MFGQGFTSASVVKFGGVAAGSVTLSGTTYLTAVVPVGAHTGPVTVKTGSTTLTSPQPFKVKPKIASFSPSSGSTGTLVTIKGSGLDPGHCREIWHGEGDDVHCSFRLEGYGGCALGALTRRGDNFHHYTGRDGQQSDEVHCELGLWMLGKPFRAAGL